MKNHDEQRHIVTRLDGLPPRGSSTGEGRRVAGATVCKRGGAAPAFWADVDTVQPG